MTATSIIRKPRAPLNRTIILDNDDRKRLRSNIVDILPNSKVNQPLTGTILGDYCEWSRLLPPEHVDLLFLDPPYNLDKTFNGRKFSRKTVDEYSEWLDGAIKLLKPLLRQTATVYICGDWLTSMSIYEAASRHFVVRNRITWEREKGRGAKRNWKNAYEDIWFCTMSDNYTFNVENVKLRRKVLAPYTHTNGDPKDWLRTPEGNYRDTYPSNFWGDITIPFWSMRENTDHPTQKSEKLLAKLILASTNQGDFVFDPFLGSGTTSVVARKLQRRFLGIEIDEEYCLLAAKRLVLAETDSEIQGFTGGVFWERNSLSMQRPRSKDTSVLDMFEKSSE